MQIDKINNISFKQNIIDSHVHIGRWEENGKIKDYTSDLDIFLKNTLPNGDSVKKCIASNLDCMQRKSNSNEFISNEIKGNKDILEVAAKNNSIIPLATCQPGYGNVQNIENLFYQNKGKFFGLKFHPECLNISG